MAPFLRTFLRSLCAPRTMLLWLAFLLSRTCAVAQNGSPALPFASTDFSVRLSGRDTTLQLPDRFIVIGTDTVMCGAQRLASGKEFTLDAVGGLLTVSGSFLSSIRDSAGTGVAALHVAYRYVPLQLRSSYARRELIVRKDTSLSDTVRTARAAPVLSMEEIFGPDLQKSGSIVRGFTVGSNRDLSLNSGIRLQLAGKIASDIDVAASLTDENTPIQPEGTTQTLQEFDRVFVELRSRNLGATLGDFALELPGTSFAGLSRKLQGAQGTALYRLNGNEGSATIAGAITRGKYATNQFAGIEGVQGPYILSGRNGERDIIVIAGTERVYIDGEAQVRGETNDYTIDYATSELTFTTRRLITGASRITVDFEYSDRQYSRSLFALRNATGFFSGKAHVTLSYLREGDDPDAPIDLLLSDSARAALAQAGADRNKASLNGVTSVDSGGLYMAVDTLVAGKPQRIYRYAPGDPQAHYQVTFSRVPYGTGDYTRQQIGIFVWAGTGNGDYAPLRFLPMPQLHQIMDAALDIAPTKQMRITGEYAHSMFDANRFSPLDDAMRGGDAFTLAAALTPRDIHVAGMSLYGIDLQVRRRSMSSTFVPLDRINDIEFNRKWGIDSTTAASEELLEAAVDVMPDSSITVGGVFGNIRRAESFRSVRNEGHLSIRSPHLPFITYQIESVRGQDSLLNNNTNWLRQHGSASYTAGMLTPQVAFEQEDRSVRVPLSGLLVPGSFSFVSIAPGLGFKQGQNLSASASLGWRIDNSYLQGAVVRESRSFTQSYAFHLADWNAISTSFDFSHRVRSYAPAFQALGNSNVTSILVRNQTRYAPANRGIETDLLYEVATERASRLERLFVLVAQGTGTYRYLGDINHNGIADEDEFIPARFDGDYVPVTMPTDRMVPVIDLHTSVRLRLVPDRFLPAGGPWWSEVLRALSSESYIRVEEKSTDPDQQAIYMLQFSHFRRDSTTMAGSVLFTQDLSLFERSREFSARYRFSQRKALYNLSGGIERPFAREHTVRLRWQLVPEIANQLEYTHRLDRLFAPAATGRTHDIASNDLSLDFSYRPEQSVELGSTMEVSRAYDRFMSPLLRADLNVQTIRLVYAFRGAGQARVETSREEVLLRPGVAAFPYELTSGRVAGKTWVWRLSLDYRITQFLQASMNYIGRSEGGASPVHTARGEVRAFF